MAKKKKLRKISASQQACLPSKCDSKPLIACEWMVLIDSLQLLKKHVALHRRRSKTQKFAVTKINTV